MEASEIAVSFHQAFNDLLCGSAQHTSHCCRYLLLQRLYGPRLFKCPYLGCSFRRHGFETRSLQRSHTTHHDRPWKCAVVGCEYSETGFLSRRMRDTHLDRFHTQDEKQGLLLAVGIRNPDKDDIQPLLFDLVRSDRTIEMKQLLGYFRALDLESKHSLLRLATTSGSGIMMGILHDAEPTLLQPKNSRYNHIFLAVLGSAVHGGNLDVVQWIITHLDTENKACDCYPQVNDSTPSIWRRSAIAWTDWSTILGLVLESDSEEIFQCLLPEFTREFTTKRSRGKLAPPPARAMDASVMKSTARILDREQRLISLWDRLRSAFGRETCSRGLRYVAETSLSVTLAKTLLYYGADIDYTGATVSVRQYTNPYRTPLQCALRRSSPEAAEMAKFLLYAGADPNATARKSSVKSVKDEKGAREISKWLGMDWDELVAKVKADREAGICPAEYRLEGFDITP